MFWSGTGSVDKFQKPDPEKLCRSFWSASATLIKCLEDLFFLLFILLYHLLVITFCSLITSPKIFSNNLSPRSFILLIYSISLLTYTASLSSLHLPILRLYLLSAYLFSAFIFSPLTYSLPLSSLRLPILCLYLLSAYLFSAFIFSPLTYSLPLSSLRLPILRLYNLSAH